MTDKPWKLVLLLSGIFLAGAVTGGVVLTRYHRREAQLGNRPEQWGPDRLNLLARRLDLSPEQIEQLRPIVKRNMDELNRLRSYAMLETHRVLQRMEADIAAELTPGQKEKFAKLTEEIRRRMQREHPGFGGPREHWMHGERHGWEGPPPSPGTDSTPDWPAEKPAEKPPGN